MSQQHGDSDVKEHEMTADLETSKGITLPTNVHLATENLECIDSKNQHLNHFWGLTSSGRCGNYEYVTCLCM